MNGQIAIEVAEEGSKFVRVLALMNGDQDIVKRTKESLKFATHSHACRQWRKRANFQLGQIGLSVQVSTLLNLSGLKH